LRRGHRESFDETQLAIGRATGQKIWKRQLEQLADRAAVNVKAYSKRLPPQGQPGDLLVLSCVSVPQNRGGMDYEE